MLFNKVMAMLVIMRIPIGDRCSRSKVLSPCLSVRMTGQRVNGERTIR